MGLTHIKAWVIIKEERGEILSLLKSSRDFCVTWIYLLPMDPVWVTAREPSKREREHVQRSKSTKTQ